MRRRLKAQEIRNLTRLQRQGPASRLPDRLISKNRHQFRFLRIVQRHQNVESTKTHLAGYAAAACPTDLVPRGPTSVDPDWNPPLPRPSPRPLAGLWFELAPLSSLVLCILKHNSTRYNQTWCLMTDVKPLLHEGKALWKEDPSLLLGEWCPFF